MAEEHVDLRRAAIGIQHIAGACLLRSTQGCALRDDDPRVGNRDQVNRIAARLRREATASGRIRRPVPMATRYLGRLVVPVRN
jgi:hypothetical protein